MKSGIETDQGPAWKQENQTNSSGRGMVVASVKWTHLEGMRSRNSCSHRAVMTYGEVVLGCERKRKRKI